MNIKSINSREPKTSLDPKVQQRREASRNVRALKSGNFTRENIHWGDIEITSSGTVYRQTVKEGKPAGLRVIKGSEAIEVKVRVLNELKRPVPPQILEAA